VLIARFVEFDSVRRIRRKAVDRSQPVRPAFQPTRICPLFEQDKTTLLPSWRKTARYRKLRKFRRESGTVIALMKAGTNTNPGGYVQAPQQSWATDAAAAVFQGKGKARWLSGPSKT
jgi:hypothetical protein